MCGAAWDPRHCPSCGERDDAEPEPYCAACGAAWDPDICPACKASNFKSLSRAELIYNEADRLSCEDCGRKWKPDGPHDTACRSCGSSRVLDSYPDIPDLSDEPGLALVLAVESQIPRAGSEGGGGAVLWREAVAWLRFHGVRDRSEILTWEWFFREIAAIRGRILEELREPAPGKGGEEEREE